MEQWEHRCQISSHAYNTHGQQIHYLRPQTDGQYNSYLVIGQLRSHETNRRSFSDNNNISQLLRDKFFVSQQPPIWEPPSHYSMALGVDPMVSQREIGSATQLS